MNVNSTKLKNYANYNGFRSILKTKPTKINVINPLTTSIDKQQFNYLKHMEKYFGRKFGVAKIENRDTGKFVNVNLRKFGVYNETVVMELNGEKLISSILEQGDVLDIFNHGLEITHILKNEEGENFKGLAKMIDRIAVKVSKSLGLGGEVKLKTAEGYGTERYAVAEPIHWSRGYIDVDYLENEAEYDKKMSPYFNAYLTSRQNGKSIEKAKLFIGTDYLPEVTMVLKEDKIKEYLKETTLLELF